MADKRNTGLEFFGILQVALIVLKLCKVVEWNWFLVLIPVEIDVAIAVVILLYYAGAWALTWYRVRKEEGGSR